MYESSVFKTLLKKISAFDGKEHTQAYEDKFFSNIVGYSDVKKLLFKCILSKEPVNILLTGPPASSKTIFLLEMLNALDGAYFMDATSTTPAGMIDYLFKYDIKYLLIDEIDKMKAKDQAALFNAMETGIISETKQNGKTRQKRMKLWIFATSNNVDRLSIALRSRFMELHLNEYTYEEFVDIVRKLLKKRYRMDENISQRIAYSVWNVMNSKDVRDAVRIAKLTKTCSDVDWLVNVKTRYSNAQ
ncbi:MAG TPA: AAA family ATPase [Nitrososphaeraceae archaeon]|nr:AAA family ATPase [Nitrososphaeraceae archaeon]